MRAELIEGTYAEENEKKPPTSGQGQKDIIEELTERRIAYRNSYCEFMFGAFCCGCCRRQWKCSDDCAKRRRAQISTYEKLNKEIDFVEYVRLKRLAEFTTSINVPVHQAYFVNKFRKYCITEPEDGKDRFVKMVKE